jgi:hypothetical protein
MKKLLITTSATLLTVAVFAQGTVIFSNGALNKISNGVAGSASSTWTVVPATAGLFNFGLFYGTGATQPGSLTFLGSVSGVNSAANAGLIVNTTGSGGINALGIPGTTPGETDVWIQVAGWSHSFGTDWAAAQTAAATTAGDYFGRSTVINVAANAGGLGPNIGPGAIIWQSASGTDPTRITGGFAMFTFGGAVTPEPSMMALAGLGMAAMLIFRRRK